MGDLGILIKAELRDKFNNRRTSFLLDPQRRNWNFPLAIRLVGSPRCFVILLQVRLFVLQETKNLGQLCTESILILSDFEYSELLASFL